MDEPAHTFHTGAIISADLTVPDTEKIRDFYREVIGWQTAEMPMQDEAGEYADYVMKDEKGGWVGGVCHRRGPNHDLPPQWIVYIQVADIARSADACRRLGGTILKESKNADGSFQYVLIQDPAGAILGLTHM